DAHGHAAGAFHRDLAAHHDAALLGDDFGNALAAGHLALLGAGFMLVDGHVDDFRLVSANLLAAGHRALDLHHAGHPALDRPGGRWAAITAAIAAVPELVEAALPVARNLTALVVALVHALGHVFRDLDVAVTGLLDRALLTVRHAHAVGPGHRLDLGDLLVDCAGKGSFFGDALALVSCVLFVAVLGLVDRAGGGVRLGDALTHLDGTELPGLAGMFCLRFFFLSLLVVVVVV